jgi:type III secretion system (T3SS) SseB-like protein
MTRLGGQVAPERVVRREPGTVDAVRTISGGDPAFRTDDGSADPEVAAALAAFATGSGSEYAALIALAGSRLLVPVVAVAAEPAPPAQGDAAPQGETGAQMALPTLIGRDGRPAVPAFTCLDALQAWRAGARPVPAAARQVCQAAAEKVCAVVIDVAGPVPFVLAGARLEALARGEAGPPPCLDPDVHEAVAAALAAHREITAFTLEPGGVEHDLAVTLALAPDVGGPQAENLIALVGTAIMARLGGRLRRGVAIRFGTCCAG